MANRVRYFNHPAFLASDWQSRNPRLQKGEMGFELDISTLLPVRAKVGPGLWNSLDYIEFAYWDDVNPVNSPIGDATGVLQGKSLKEILDLMLNPYVAPVFSGVLNDAGSVFAAESILEIGQTLSGNVNVQYSLSNQANLVGATPINITSLPSVFSNEGNFAVGSQALALTAPLTPSVVTDYVITLIATHTNGTSTDTTNFKFVPRILTGVSQNSTILPSEWVNLSNKASYVSDVFERDYTFGAIGYHYLAIPSMLSPGAPVFTDVTNPNAPGPYGFDYIGQQTINNGVGSYAYETYRSTYLITQNSSILRVAT